MEVLKEYNLISHNKIEYGVLNNASNNGRAIEELGRKLQWRDPASRRIRCFGHILRLVARAMLFVNDGSALEDLGPEEFNEWTKADPVGKLHNLVVWVSRSNKITTAPRRLQDEDLEMNYPGALDGDALSWLKDILEMFDSCLLRLEGNGQVRLRKRGAEAQYDIVWQVAIAYEFLLVTLEKAKLEAKDRTEPRYHSSYINSAWAKLNKYYTKLDETPV
ncbi:hypothetical protein FOVSG1_006582 [Fusarium oxysporum f. sp. vasinfectum]